MAEKVSNWPGQRYKLIYADPPWKYNNGQLTPYEQMTLKDIKKLPIHSLTEQASILFLWATAPCMPEALDVIRAWGFTYKTIGFTWIKRNKTDTGWFFGLGNYTRANAEYCLIGVKGKGLERKDKGVSSLIISPIQEHSRKPAIVRKKIEQMYGPIPRAELFARERREGWDSYGDELDKFKDGLG
jgi:site-specific DNA-methyltransferase (adenine-specific)